METGTVWVSGIKDAKSGSTVTIVKSQPPVECTRISINHVRIVETLKCINLGSGVLSFDTKEEAQDYYNTCFDEVKDKYERIQEKIKRTLKRLEKHVK